MAVKKSEDCYEVEQWLQLTEEKASPNSQKTMQIKLHATQTGYGVDTNKGVWVKLTVKVPKRLFGQHANAILDLSDNTSTTEFALDTEVVKHDLLDLKDSLE